MPEIKMTITHEVGLHARPASMFVQTAAKFSSDIEVTHGETTANAKSILAVLTLGAHKDDGRFVARDQPRAAGPLV